MNVIIESYDLMRNKFPFSKGGQQSSMNGGVIVYLFRDGELTMSATKIRVVHGISSITTIINPITTIIKEITIIRDIATIKDITIIRDITTITITITIMAMAAAWTLEEEIWEIKWVMGISLQFHLIIMLLVRFIFDLEIIGNGQKFVGTSRISLDKIRTQHTSALESVQYLDIMKYSLQSE